MNEIVLSEEFSIWKGEYKGKYSLHSFLELVKLNDKLAIHTNNNSVWVEIESPVFNSVNLQVIDFIEKLTGKYFLNYAKHNWVYTQTKGFDLTWMHQHIQVHPPGRSNILTDYTFTFYLQTPMDIEGDEGHIVFQTEDGKHHKFLPQEGDIFLFPAELRHTAIPTPNSKKDRIVFAGSFCIDVYNQKEQTNKSAI